MRRLVGIGAVGQQAMMMSDAPLMYAGPAQQQRSVSVEYGIGPATFASAAEYATPVEYGTPSASADYAIPATVAPRPGDYGMPSADYATPATVAPTTDYATPATDRGVTLVAPPPRYQPEPPTDYEVAPVQPPPPPGYEEPPIEPEEIEKRKKKWLVGGILAGVLVLVGITYLVVRKKKKAMTPNRRRARRGRRMSPQASRFTRREVERLRDKEGYSTRRAVAAAYAQARRKGYKVPRTRRRKRGERAHERKR